MCRPIPFMALALLASAMACSPLVPPTAPRASADTLVSQGASAINKRLHGRIDLTAFGYQILAATTAEIANAATVSIIDANSNATLATTVTTARGDFDLDLAADFVPAVGRGYHLEAIKGLRDNLPGHAAVRIRTIVVWTDQGWTSLTSRDPGAPVLVNKSTTAIAAIVGLRAGTRQAIEPSKLVGSLQIGVQDATVAPGTPDTFAPSGGLRNLDFHLGWAVVNQALAADGDPVRAMAPGPGGFNPPAPDGDPVRAMAPGPGGFNPPAPDGDPVRAMAPGVEVLRVTPGNAQVGDEVQILGNGFDLRARSNQVEFTGLSALAYVMRSTGGSLQVRVPDRAVSGPLTITVGTTRVQTRVFLVKPKIQYVDSSVRSGARLTVSGFGFDPSGSRNLVKVGKQTVPIVSLSANYLRVHIPREMFPGTYRVSVTTPGGTGVSPTTTVVR